jgi:DsbC/DsbD-like thiol-disulfide interchange protein/cytochrome c biogenesis protein CcdA
MNHSRYFLLFSLWLCLGATLTHAQPAGLSFLEEPAELELVSEMKSVAPGETFLAAFVLKPEEKWHSYWVNPAFEGGIPPGIQWTLPEGVVAGPIQWPYPLRYDQQGQVFFGHEGETWLLMQITVPATAPAGPMTLNAEVEALFCKESCVRVAKKLAITVDIGPAGIPDPALAAGFAKAKERLPQVLPKLEGSAAVTGEDIVLRFRGLPATAKEAGLFFFPLNDSVDSLAPQAVSWEGEELVIRGKGKAGPVEGVLAGTKPVGDGVEAVQVTKDMVVAGVALPDAGGAGGSVVVPVKGIGLWLLLQAFLGGIILNVMPCVFPVLGLKIMGFVNQGGKDPRKIIMHGVVYTLGVVIFFLALGASIKILQAGGETVGLGTQFQNPVFVYIMAILMLVLGMSFAGSFEIGTSLTGVGGSLTQLSGYAGSFFSGLLTVVLATPCAGFLLGPVIGVAFGLPFAPAMVVFGFMAFGIAFPYLFFAFFPSLVKALPRPGPWMVAFKQFLAILMFGAVLWMGWVMSGQVESWPMLLSWLSLAIIAVAAWLYGLSTAHGVSRKNRVIGLVATVVIGGYAVFLGWPRVEAPLSEVDDQSSLAWAPWSQAAVDKARAEGLPVYIDFTARWCLQCQFNKRVYKHDSVKDVFAKKGVVTFVADWTNHDDDIGKAIAALQRGAVPVNVLYLPGQDAPVILPEVLTDGNPRALPHRR